MEISINPTIKQHQVYQALRDPTVDEVFFGGGAGGGKSWLICESRLINCYLFPGYRSFIAREELKRLMGSTYLTWLEVCKHHHIPRNDWKLNGQYNYLEFANGSRVDLLDVKFAPSDPLYERFGSMEFSDGALEEAGEIHALAREVLKSRINRHLNRELGIKANLLSTGNPKKNWTYNVFYKPWKEGKLPNNMRFIQALYNDNPYTAQDYGNTLSQITDQAMRERLKDGNWEYNNDPSALIDYDSITDIFTISIDNEDKENKYLICDVARFGRDSTVVTLWEGMECYKILQRQKQGVDVTIDWLKDLLREHKIPYSHALIDEDGVGGGVVDGLKGCKGFMANRTPFDNPTTEKPDNFENLKAQCGYTLAEMICNHKLSVKCEDELIKTNLIEELEWIKSKDADNDGKRKLLPKEIIKENINRSPDFSDNLLMRMYFFFDKVKKAPTVINKSRTPYISPSPFGG